MEKTTMVKTSYTEFDAYPIYSFEPGEGRDIVLPKDLLDQYNATINLLNDLRERIADCIFEQDSY